MERCQGKTKSGERCKRSAPEGSVFCGLHAGQGEAEPDDGQAPEETVCERDLLDTLVVMAAAGVALGMILVFRRVFRFI